jgi:hypothetical protein
LVMGYSLVPEPPANTIPFISSSLFLFMVKVLIIPFYFYMLHIPQSMQSLCGTEKRL